MFLMLNNIQLYSLLTLYLHEVVIDGQYVLHVFISWNSGAVQNFI